MSGATASFLAVLFGCTTTALFGVLGVMARAFYKLAIDVRLMRQGATEGAQILIRALASRVDVVEDAYEQITEGMAKEHERVSIIDNTIQGHIRTPSTYAHPPQPVI